jgi:hypothetical protein
VTVDLGYRVESLSLNLVVAVFTECNLDYITCQGEYQDSLLISVDVHNVETEDLEGKGAQLDGFHALKQVVVPDVDHASHGADRDAFKTFGDRGYFVFVVF